MMNDFIPNWKLCERVGGRLPISPHYKQNVLSKHLLMHTSSKIRIVGFLFTGGLYLLKCAFLFHSSPV